MKIFILICFCRYYGRKILHIVHDHPEFDKQVSKHVPSNLQKNVRDTVENLRTKVSSRYFFMSRNTPSFLLRDELYKFLREGLLSLASCGFRPVRFLIFFFQTQPSCPPFFHRVSVIPPRTFPLLPGSGSPHPVVGTPEAVECEVLWCCPRHQIPGKTGQHCQFINMICS